LDGGRVLVGLLPRGAAYQLSRVEPFGFFIVLALLILGVLGTWWISPLVRASYTILIAPILSLAR
ncbi:MAG: site-2 protease family protein, partial [Comamonadaceae bacterium]